MNVVQIFKEDDLMEVAMDQEKIDEWKKITGELGLDKQSKFLEGDKKSPIPFPAMNDRMYNMVKTLCPSSALIENYDYSPLPLEVLKIVAFCKSEKYFSKIHVFYDQKSLDPFLVGVIEEDIIGWWKGAPDDLRGRTVASISPDIKIDPKWLDTREVSRYLLAKWGDVNRGIDELVEMAKRRYIVEKGAECRKEIKKAEQILATLEEDAIERFPVC